MTPTTLEPDHVVYLLERDVSHTLGDGFHEDVLSIAENTRSIALSDEAVEADGLEKAQRYFGQMVVDDFQQYVQDTFVDTTWPACPRHPNHPLDYDHETGAWCCPRDGAAIFPLGELRRS
ncbi:MAG TPA: hypothetical protein VF746_27075 [Longimicrobium sp.]|jgi:hypothetical protein